MKKSKEKRRRATKISTNRKLNTVCNQLQHRKKQQQQIIPIFLYFPWDFNDSHETIGRTVK